MSAPAAKPPSEGVERLECGDLAGERILELRVTARPRRLRMVRAAVEQAARLVGCSRQVANDIVIAVDEACQNVIRHAYRGDPDGEIVLDIRSDGECIGIDLVDYAEPVDAASVRPRPLDELRPGGLGTHFIRECMDEVFFGAPPCGAGNRLRMIRRIE